MQTERDTPPKGPYDEDFVEWLAAQSAAIREGRWADIDVENLTEEIDSLARRDKREMLNRLVVLLMHLLKKKHQPERMSDSWWQTIDEQSSQIGLILEDSPSLRLLLPEYVERAYPRARKQAALETRLALKHFPERLAPALVRELDKLLAPERP